jgi:hypothetical protein
MERLTAGGSTCTDSHLEPYSFHQARSDPVWSPPESLNLTTHLYKMQNNMEEVSGTASSLSAILQKISTDLEHESTLKEVSICLGIG